MNKGMKTLRKRIALVLAAVAIVVLGGTTTAVLADKKDKPPKAASDHVRKAVINPSADPDDIGGPVDPALVKAAIMERNPATGDVVRDNRGRPQFIENPDGTPRMFAPDEFPPEQVEAYRQWHVRLNAAQAGDRAAQAHLANEERKTAEATGRP